MFRIFLSVFISLFAIQSLAKDGQLTLLHWWVSPGEERAFNIILDEAARRGIVVETSPQDNHSALREQLVDLMHIGQKPDFSQWLASEDLSTFAVNNQASAFWPEILEKIQPQLLPLVTYEGSLAAIPVVSHMQNSMFYNSALFSSLNIPEPQNWADIEASWEVFQENGIQPVLTSDETWQLRMLFGDILIGVGGIEAHNHFFSETFSPSLVAALEKSFSTLSVIRDFQTEDSTDLNWADAAEKFANGEVGYFFLGDFAWAEMAHQPNAKDIVCQPVPSGQKALIYGTDIFLVFPSADAGHENLQRAFAEVILDAEVQQAFVFEKGGVPVVRDVNMDLLAPCAKSALSMIEDPEAIIKNTPWADSRIALYELEAQIERFWQDPEITPEMATHEILTSLNMVE